jgi:hypothetical protein
MGVTVRPGNIYQPTCDECGIALCWCLEQYEYNIRMEYWDNWKCKDCDPEYFERWAQKQRDQHRLERSAR